jgi:hypothetical protein
VGWGGVAWGGVGWGGWGGVGWGGVRRALPRAGVPRAGLPLKRTWDAAIGRPAAAAAWMIRALTWHAAQALCRPLALCRCFPSPIPLKPAAALAPPPTPSRPQSSCRATHSREPERTSRGRACWGPARWVQTASSTHRAPSPPAGGCERLARLARSQGRAPAGVAGSGLPLLCRRLRSSFCISSPTPRPTAFRAAGAGREEGWVPPFVPRPPPNQIEQHATTEPNLAARYALLGARRSIQGGRARGKGRLVPQACRLPPALARLGSARQRAPSEAACVRRRRDGHASR